MLKPSRLDEQNTSVETFKTDRIRLGGWRQPPIFFFFLHRKRRFSTFPSKQRLAVNCRFIVLPSSAKQEHY